MPRSSSDRASADLGRWSALVGSIAAVVDLDASARQHGALGRLRLALVDGSRVSGPGSRGSDSRGSDWRLHARYEPARGGFTDLRLSPAATAETLAGLAMGPGDGLVQDRGYARAREFAHAQSQGCAVITRIGWRPVKLSDAAGAPFDLLAALPEQGPAVVEHALRIGQAATGQAAIPARLILAWLPPEAVERQGRRLRRKASRRGTRTDPRSVTAAGFLMLLTAVPAEQADAEAIVGRYRLCRQIAVAFERLKSLGGFGDLRADDPRPVRARLLAHLIAAVLVEAALGEAGLGEADWARIAPFPPEPNVPAKPRA